MEESHGFLRPFWYVSPGFLGSFMVILLGLLLTFFSFGVCFSVGFAESEGWVLGFSMGSLLSWCCYGFLNLKKKRCLTLELIFLLKKFNCWETEGSSCSSNSCIECLLWGQPWRTVRKGLLSSREDHRQQAEPQHSRLWGTYGSGLWIGRAAPNGWVRRQAVVRNKAIVDTRSQWVCSRHAQTSPARWGISRDYPRPLLAEFCKSLVLFSNCCQHKSQTKEFRFAKKHPSNDQKIFPITKKRKKANQMEMGMAWDTCRWLGMNGDGWRWAGMMGRRESSWKGLFLSLDGTDGTTTQVDFEHTHFKSRIELRYSKVP